MIVSFTKCHLIGLFCIASPFLSISQDSAFVAVSDGASTYYDTADHRFKTAGKVWKNVISSVPDDFVQMGKIISKDWKKTAAYTGGIALLILADKPITQFYQDHVERHIDYNLPTLPGASNSLYFRGNDAYLNYSILALYGGSLATNYKTGQRAALNSIKALTYSYLIGHVGLKALFARQRPDATLSDGIDPRPPYTSNPLNFFNFRPINFRTGPNGTAFPSMHATAYYAVAKVLAMEFDNYWIPYGAVTFIFFADLDSHQHWVGDMIAGGILGTLIGKGIVNSSRRWEKKQAESKSGVKRHRKFNFNYQLLPMVSTHSSGITLLGSF